jgi:hypothetical protein
MTNQTVLGVRYQGVLGPLGVLAYAAWETSGHANYTGLTTAAVLGTSSVPGSKFNGQYDGLNFGSGGAALTYGGWTFSANAIGGDVNEQGALKPKGGVSESAVIVGLKYVTGGLTVGATVEKVWDQGNVVLLASPSGVNKGSRPVPTTSWRPASRSSANTCMRRFIRVPTIS